MCRRRSHSTTSTDREQILTRQSTSKFREQPHPGWTCPTAVATRGYGPSPTGRAPADSTATGRCPTPCTTATKPNGPVAAGVAGACRTVRDRCWPRGGQDDRGEPTATLPRGRRALAGGAVG